MGLWSTPRTMIGDVDSPDLLEAEHLSEVCWRCFPWHLIIPQTTANADPPGIAWDSDHPPDNCRYWFDPHDSWSAESHTLTIGSAVHQTAAHARGANASQDPRHHALVLVLAPALALPVTVDSARTKTAFPSFHVDAFNNGRPRTSNCLHYRRVNIGFLFVLLWLWSARQEVKLDMKPSIAWTLGIPRQQRHILIHSPLSAEDVGGWGGGRGGWGGWGGGGGG